MVTARPPDHRPRPREVLQALGLVVALVTVLVLAPAPRAAAATPHLVTSPKSVFCALFPFLCPRSSPSPSPSATPPASGSKVPGIPGLTFPGRSAQDSGTAAADDAPASSCDAAKIPGASSLRTLAGARQAVSILEACLAARAKSATATGSGTAPDPAAASAAVGNGRVSPLATHLTASKETMNGFGYDGIVTLQTSAGPVRALKFHATSVVIEGMRQDVAYRNGRMALTPGGTVTLSGHVLLYVLSQSGKAFGLLPLTISPRFTLPVVPPFLTFTDVDSTLALIQADSLTVPATSIRVT